MYLWFEIKPFESRQCSRVQDSLLAFLWENTYASQWKSKCSTDEKQKWSSKVPQGLYTAKSDRTANQVQSQNLLTSFFSIFLIPFTLPTHRTPKLNSDAWLSRSSISRLFLCYSLRQTLCCYKDTWCTFPHLCFPSCWCAKHLLTLTSSFKITICPWLLMTVSIPPFYTPTAF